MRKQVIYKYLGTNGIIESPVHLEDTYYVRLLDLIADEGYLLTNGIITRKSIRIPEEELENWQEIKEE